MRTSEYGSYVIGLAVGVGFGTMLSAYVVFRWEEFAAELSSSLLERLRITLACFVIMQVVVVPIEIASGIWIALRFDRMTCQEFSRARQGSRHSKTESDYTDSLDNSLRHWLLAIAPPFFFAWFSAILVWFIPVYFRSQDLQDRVYKDFVNLPTMFYEMVVGIVFLACALIWLIKTRVELLRAD
mgnify:FL=1